MTPERYSQVMQIIDAVIDCDFAQREAILAEACAADESLRREVEVLLAHHQPASKFMEESPFETRPRADESLTGKRIGPYCITSEIGRGGMGVVYLAERDDQQFAKRVAIKLIKRGMDTDFVVRRFRNERQILASLDHPNIGRLLDGGATEADLPYFVMEYVEGDPIIKYADANNLNTTERLKLFRMVCSAVQYAHQNLIIHRDLKPSNVLVTKEGEPKLLDFGIAKLLQADGEAETALTATAVRVMTPEYASPEQVKGERITTASDVYSLGVLLYELLTGTRPYRVKSRQPEEIARAICEQQPEKPSVAASGQWSVVSWSEPPAVAGGPNPQSAIRNPRFLRGDLDNIVLMALRKEPARRYQSVNDLSEDIRRHLEGLPISAHKDTFGYRASKFVKRNKIGVVAAALIVLTMAAGIIATTVQARRANRRYNEMRALTHSVLFDYHDEIAALPGSTKVRERLVKDGLQYLDNLSKDTGNDVSLLRELATAYEKVAAVQGGVAISSHGTALASSNLGDTKGAIESLNKALAIRGKVLAMEPSNKEMQQDLANCYAAMGLLYMSTGPPDKAAENLHKALPIIEALLAADPTNETLQMNLVNAEAALSKVLGNPQWPNLGDTNGALEYLNKARQLQEKLAVEHPTNRVYQLYVAGLHNNLGWVLNGMSGKLPEALEHMQEALVIEQGLVKEDPGNTLFRSQVAIQFTATGRIRLNMGDKHGALADFNQGLSIAEALLKADPNDASTRRLVAVFYRQIAEALASTGDINGGLDNFRKAQQMFAELVAKDPINEDYQLKLATVYIAMSRVQSQAGDLNGALDSANQGIKIAEVLVAAAPTNSPARNTLAQLYSQLGASNAALAEKGRQMEHWRAAKDAYQKSLDIYQDMKNKGTLSGADVGKPVEIANEIAKCDGSLKISK